MGAADRRIEIEQGIDVTQHDHIGIEHQEPVVCFTREGLNAGKGEAPPLESCVDVPGKPQGRQRVRADTRIERLQSRSFVITYISETKHDNGMARRPSQQGGEHDRHRHEIGAVGQRRVGETIGSQIPDPSSDSACRSRADPDALPLRDSSSETESWPLLG